MAEDPRIPVLSNFELRALAVTGSRAVQRVGDEDGLPYDASEEQKREYEERSRRKQEEAEARQQTALDEFNSALTLKIADAYHAGEIAAVDRADRNAWNARSITLYLVVLAVVAMPVIAMVTKLSPQAFGSYIAPVTGIAGTVVGYWFGTLNRPGGRDNST